MEHLPKPINLRQPQSKENFLNIVRPRRRTKILTTILTVLISAFVVSGAVFAGTTIGQYISIGTGTPALTLGEGDLYVTGTAEVDGTLAAKTGGAATFVVAASNASDRVKNQADYVADGTADNVEIQAAIDALPAGGGKVVLSEGTFNTNATVTIDGKPVSIVGQGMYATIVKLSNSSNVNIISVGLTTSVNGFYLGYLTLDGNKANQTSGSGLSLNRAPNGVIDHVRITSTKERGITGTGFSFVKATVRDSVIENADDWGISVDNMLDFKVEGGRFDGNTEGVRFTQSGPAGVATVTGAFFRNNGTAVEFNGIEMGTAQGLHLVGNTGVGIHGLDTEYFSAIGNIIEDGQVNGIDSGRALHVTIVGNIVKSISGGAEQRGILVYRAISGVVDGNVTDSNGHQGIQISESSDIVVSNNICKNNGQSGSQGQGIRVWALSADVNRVVVRGNRCFDDQGTKTQTDGIKLQAESGFTLTGAIVEGNHLEGNGTNAYSTGGAGTITGTIVRGNRGYITEASGTSTIASAATSTTITHGLSVTPAAGDCSFVGAEDPDNSVGSMWIDTYTSTQMALNVENDPGASNFDVNWSCQVL
jgi:parallel beta-helix repeat protein